MAVVGFSGEKWLPVNPDVGGRIIVTPRFDPEIDRTIGCGHLWLGPFDLDSTDKGICLDVIIGHGDQDSPQRVNGYSASAQCVRTSLQEGYKPNDLVIVNGAIEGSRHDNTAVFSGWHRDFGIEHLCARSRPLSNLDVIIQAAGYLDTNQMTPGWVGILSQAMCNNVDRFRKWCSTPFEYLDIVGFQPTQPLYVMARKEGVGIVVTHKIELHCRKVRTRR